MPDPFRIAAVADLHYGRTSRKELSAIFEQAADAADALLLCGDLTDHGRVAEGTMLVDDLHAYASGMPVLAVLGNHDFETAETPAMLEVLADAGVRVLDGECHSIDGIGFAGVSGFGGGFDQFALHPWGEPLIKEFVQTTVNEVLKLEKALGRLETEIKIVLLHYAPIRETVVGEPLEIYPFLGSSRLEDPLNHFQVTAAFHGHAHKGSPEAVTSTGTRVFNVSMPLLRSRNPSGPALKIFEVERPG